MPKAAIVDGPQVSQGARERMLAGLSLTERRPRLAGVATALLEGGEGPPLVLLHGGIECGGAYWAPVVLPLAQENRLIVPDIPGLGESQPFRRLDADAFSEWLRALIGETCAEPPGLVAHSLTGTLAARFALRHPGQLRRLAIYASPGVGPYRMPLRLRALAVRFALRPSEQNMRRFQRFALLDPEQAGERDPAWFDAFTVYTAARARDAGVKRTMRGLVRAGTKAIPDDQLRALAVPVALLWGSEDRMTPLSLGEAAGARLGWRLHRINGAAHAPHIEAPDAFLEALAEWRRSA